jgi:hypothetical protein
VILWSALHDAQLERITSDRLARTIELVFDIAHLREMSSAPDSMRFVLRGHGVTSVRAQCSEHAGPVPSLDGLPPEEQARVIEEYRARWREESIDWSALEKTVTQAERLWILEAELLRGEGATLRLFGEHHATERYPTMFIRAERFEVEQEGASIGIEGLQALGERYWDAFGAHSKD